MYSKETISSYHPAAWRNLHPTQGWYQPHHLHWQDGTWYIKKKSVSTCHLLQYLFRLCWSMLKIWDHQPSTATRKNTCHADLAAISSVPFHHLPPAFGWKRCPSEWSTAWPASFPTQDLDGPFLLDISFSILDLQDISRNQIWRWSPWKTRSRSADCFESPRIKENHVKHLRTSLESLMVERVSQWSSVSIIPFFSAKALCPFKALTDNRLHRFPPNFNVFFK